MPKYYIQSGDVSMVVNAHDAEAAALWAIHQHSQVPESATATVSAENEQAWDDLLPGFADLPELGTTIRVSERGLGRNEAGHFVTQDALRKYGQLLVAIERLLGE